MKELLIIAISSALVSNVVLSQFLGICSFVGVSKKVETAAGMGGAVIFVITIASIVANLIYQFVLAPLGIDYLKTIVFILVIAALVQIVEMFLKKNMVSLYEALGFYFAGPFFSFLFIRRGIKRDRNIGVCRSLWLQDFYAYPVFCYQLKTIVVGKVALPLVEQIEGCGSSIRSISGEQEFFFGGFTVFQTGSDYCCGLLRVNG